MSSYIVVIPTYKRYEGVTKRTLATLKRHGIQKKRVYLFVATEEEKKAYEANVPKSLYGHIVVGVPGLRDQRNFITKYFPEGTNIVEFDDDVEEIYQMVPGKEKKDNKIVPIKNLHSLFVDAFRRLKKEKLGLWGIYPVDNPYFMQDKVTTDLRFAVGPMWGKVNSHDETLQLELMEKEDVERTLKSYRKYGGVLRYNNVTMLTNFYTTEGGYQAEKRNQKKDSRRIQAKQNAMWLHSQFPNCTTMFIRPSGHPEVRLRGPRVENPPVDCGKPLSMNRVKKMWKAVEQKRMYRRSRSKKHS